MTDGKDLCIRAAKAKELLNNEMFNEAFSLVREKYGQLWLETGDNDTESRERLWIAIKILESVRKHLEMAVDSGKVEAYAEEFKKKRGWFER